MTTGGVFPVLINADPATIWPYIVDLGKHAEWSPTSYEVELVSGSTGAVGAHYRSVGWIPGDKHHANDVDVTEVEPNRHFAFVAHDDPGDVQNSFDLRETQGGTEVEYRMHFPKVSGVSAILLPVLFPLVGKPKIRERMKMLKSLVETGAASR